MRRVYLIEEPKAKRDISGAEIFGEVVTCLTRKDESLSTGMTLNRLRSKLRDYGEGDYILFAGGDWPVLLCVGVVLKEMNLKSFDILVWKKMADKTGAYIPNRIFI